MAMMITFLVSSIGHELVMGCITKKLRGYGFIAMMLQLPIVALQRSEFVRGRTLFNVSFLLPLDSDRLSRLTMGLAERLFLDLYDSWIVHGKQSCLKSP